MNGTMKPIPQEIGRANEHDVKIRWNDGTENIYPARFLRLACGCAACVDEMSGRRTLHEEDVAPDVHPLRIGLVGRYAMHISWSDGHASGIYGFEYLKGLAEKLK
jgi:ATP-binding protein involved in chromosome partitioning